MDWRGDLSFSCAGINEVDSLIFSIFAYLDYPFVNSSPMTIAAAADRIFSSPDKNRYCSISFIAKNAFALLDKAHSSTRYKDVVITSFRDISDESRQMQFSAVTFLINDEEAFIAVLNTLQNISKIRNNPTFEPFNLSFRETQELHDAINAFDLDTIQTILYLNNESVFEQIQDNIDSRIYESNLLNTIRTIQQDIVGFQYYNPSDIAEITINGKTKKIFFPNADQITPIQLPDNIADDLIKSNLLTMDIINKLEQFNIELPSTGHSNLAISSGKNKSVLKIKYSIQDLIAKAKSQGIDSLSSHEIHVLTDCFDTLYRSTKDPQFIKLVNSIINDKNNNQHLRLIYAYIKKMKELAQPILKRNKVQIEDHAYMRMLDRNLISVADHNNNRMLSFEEFIKLLSSKVKDTKEKELYIQGFHNGNIIKLLLKSGDNGTTIIDSIMLQ